MNELSSSEVEKVLLFVSDARNRARKARAQLVAEGAEEHVVEAMERAESSLGEAHRDLMQGTYFAVPEHDKQLAL
jgi:cellobiose-specific phosphotransferase system component IIA